MEWPDGYTIDYQLVQHYHLAQADMSDPANPSYSIGETFKSVDMTTSASGTQTADNVHAQAIGSNIPKPSEGTVIAEIKGLPMFGCCKATAEDVTAAAEAGVTLTEGVVYPVVYTYGAKETAVKKNGESILPFIEKTVDSERDKTKPDTYNATLTNEITPSTGSVQVTKTFVFPDGSALSVPEEFKVTASWKIDEKEYSIALNTKDNLEQTGSDTDYQVSAVAGNGSTDSPYSWTISGLPVGTEVTFTEANYNIPGYVVTSKVTDSAHDNKDGITGKATSSAEAELPGSAKVAFTNTYVAGVMLPSTGGPGTVLYTEIGRAHV